SGKHLNPGDRSLDARRCRRAVSSDRMDHVRDSEERMDHAVRRLRIVIALALLALSPAAAAAAPEGQMVWAVHVTLAPRWLDPGDTESAITPFLVLYALHDALVKPMPAGQSTPSLAESWTMSPDGLTYEFLLRNGVTFHNG